MSKGHTPPAGVRSQKQPVGVEAPIDLGFLSLPWELQEALLVDAARKDAEVFRHLAQTKETE